MYKSIHSKEYRAVLRLLRRAREAAGVTQAEFARRLGQSQSFVSKCERGERRLDIVELRQFCLVLKISFTGFVRKVDEELGAGR